VTGRAWPRGHHLQSLGKDHPPVLGSPSDLFSFNSHRSQRTKQAVQNAACRETCLPTTSSRQIYSFIYSFIHLFIYSFIHLFIYSFIHLFIHSFRTSLSTALGCSHFFQLSLSQVSFIYLLFLACFLRLFIVFFCSSFIVNGVSRSLKDWVFFLCFVYLSFVHQSLFFCLPTIVLLIIHYCSFVYPPLFFSLIHQVRCRWMR
jgi:hypothetical protein